MVGWSVSLSVTPNVRTHGVDGDPDVVFGAEDQTWIERNKQPLVCTGRLPGLDPFSFR